MKWWRKAAEQGNAEAQYELGELYNDGFVCIGLDRGKEWDVKVIVDAKVMQETTAHVMKRNIIPFDRSEDLRSK